MLQHQEQHFLQWNISVLLPIVDLLKDWIFQTEVLTKADYQ